MGTLVRHDKREKRTIAVREMEISDFILGFLNEHNILISTIF
jgi:hypothetical protein